MMLGSAESPRGWSDLLREQPFGLFFAGRLVSTLGYWVQNLAAAVLMFGVTGSALMVGMVSVLQFLPILLFSLWSGALTDQVDRRKLLLMGRVTSGLSMLALAALLALRGQQESDVPFFLLLATFTSGTGWSFSLPAMQALVPGLVPRRDLESAIGLDAVAPSIGRTVGPAMGAGLLLIGGPALAFAAAACAHLAFAATLSRLRGYRPAPAGASPNIWGGLRYLTNDRRAGRLVLGLAVLGLGTDPVVTLTPTLAALAGGGGELVGLLVMGFGTGAIASAIAFRRLRIALTIRRVGILGFWILAAGLLIAAASYSTILILAGFVAQGFGFMMASVALTTRVQRRVPDAIRGRVMALWGIAFIGSRPIAALINGALADTLSVGTALVVSSLAMTLASGLAFVAYRDRAPPN